MSSLEASDLKPVYAAIRTAGGERGIPPTITAMITKGSIVREAAMRLK